MAELSEEALQELYTWIDAIPLSRPKKDLKRDFSDGGKFSLNEVNYVPFPIKVLLFFENIY